MPGAVVPTSMMWRLIGSNAADPAAAPHFTPSSCEERRRTTTIWPRQARITMQNAKTASPQCPSSRRTRCSPLPLDSGETLVYRNAGLGPDGSVQQRCPAELVDVRERIRYLGGWFVLGPFITPVLFQPYPSAPEEYTLATLMPADGTLQSTMETHYDTFITEQDFAQIAEAGLNWVRVPIPFRAIRCVAVVPSYLLIVVVSPASVPPHHPILLYSTPSRLPIRPLVRHPARHHPRPHPLRRPPRSSLSASSPPPSSFTIATIATCLPASLLILSLPSLPPRCPTPSFLNAPPSPLLPLPSPFSLPPLLLFLCLLT
ncbi:hypothetical protein B0H11DRAFT_2248168 [Mycena galericulata]|nr:hypothetical protein B0H11DRAFT_2248168 [Mycena galericulata]